MQEPQERRGLPRLMLRFPSSRNALKSRYVSDAEFRSLCAAYEDAHEALRMREQTAMALTHEMADYQQLVLDIESDINTLLPGSPHCGCQDCAEIKFMTRFAPRWRAIINLFRS